MYGTDPQDLPIETTVVDVDFSEKWIAQNPKLAIKSVAEFCTRFPSDKWNVYVKDAYMPGMSITLRASRK